MARVFLIGLLVAASTGCSNSTESLHSELTAARAECKELRSELDALKQNFHAAKGEMDHKSKSDAATVAAVREDCAQLQKAWIAFETSFSPDLRKALAENVNAAEKSVQSTKRAADTADEAISTLKKLLAEAEEFKKQCGQHAKEAQSLNEIGALKAAAKDLQGSMTTIKGEMASIKRDAEDALRRARGAESKASSAESRASSAASDAQRALSRSR